MPRGGEPGHRALEEAGADVDPFVGQGLDMGESVMAIVDGHVRVFEADRRRWSMVTARPSKMPALPSGTRSSFIPSTEVPCNVSGWDI